MWKLTLSTLTLVLLVANLGGDAAEAPPRVMVVDMEGGNDEEMMMHDHLRHHLTKEDEDFGRLLLEFKEHDPPYKLGRCQGDCDNDNQCQGDLVCFQRGYNEGANVPGCRGSDNSRTDYCVNLCDWKPSSPNCGEKDDAALDDPGDDEDPPPPSNPYRKTDVKKVAQDLYDGRRLGLCESDCDGDHQCKSGLECHQRDYGDPIPSACCGSRSNSDDICAPPEPDFERYSEPTDFVGNYDHAKGALGLCQGDCDDDCDCEIGLVCWGRDYKEPLPPDCYGSKYNSWDYCAPAPNKYDCRTLEAKDVEYKIDADEMYKTFDVLENVCCGYDIEIVDVDEEKDPCGYMRIRDSGTKLRYYPDEEDEFPYCFDTNEDTTVRYRFKVENECGKTDWAEIKIKVKGNKINWKYDCDDDDKDDQGLCCDSQGRRINDIKKCCYGKSYDKTCCEYDDDDCSSKDPEKEKADSDDDDDDDDDEDDAEEEMMELLEEGEDP